MSSDLARYREAHRRTMEARLDLLQGGRAELPDDLFDEAAAIKGAETTARSLERALRSSREGWDPVANVLRDHSAARALVNSRAMHKASLNRIGKLTAGMNNQMAIKAVNGPLDLVTRSRT